MRWWFGKTGSVMVFAAVLASVVPSYAQDPSQPPAVSAPSDSSRFNFNHAGSGGFAHGESEGGDRVERRDLREERMRIRADHEQLEAEREKLRSQCGEGGGTDRAGCEEQRKALRERGQALHERVRTLREKVEAARGGAGEHGRRGEGGGWGGSRFEGGERPALGEGPMRERHPFSGSGRTPFNN